MQTKELNIVNPFEEGYDATRFIIETTVKKVNEDEYVADGKMTQSRANYTDDGNLIWDDRIIESTVVGKDETKVSNTALKELYGYLISKEFNLFDVEEEDDESKDDLQAV